MRNYQKYANLLLVCGIASAIMFDHSAKLRPLYGGLGILCAILAGVLYFCERWKDSSSNTGKDLGLIKENTALSPLHDNLRENLKRASYVNYEHVLTEAMQGYVALKSGTEMLERIKRSHAAVLSIQWQPERHFADEVVEIVDRLCSERRSESFVFVIAPDGTFTINHPGRTKSDDFKTTEDPRIGALSEPVN